MGHPMCGDSGDEWATREGVEPAASFPGLRETAQGAEGQSLRIVRGAGRECGG